MKIFYNIGSLPTSRRNLLKRIASSGGMGPGKGEGVTPPYTHTHTPDYDFFKILPVVLSTRFCHQNVQKKKIFFLQAKNLSYKDRSKSRCLVPIYPYLRVRQLNTSSQKRTRTELSQMMTCVKIHSRLISLKIWFLSMLIIISITDASLILCERLFHNAEGTVDTKKR